MAAGTIDCRVVGEPVGRPHAPEFVVVLRNRLEHGARVCRRALGETCATGKPPVRDVIRLLNGYARAVWVVLEEFGDHDV